MNEPSAADQLAIMQLGSRYFAAIDAQDFEGWSSCFVDGGRFEGAFQSYDAHRDIERFRKDAFELAGRWPALRHQAGVPLIAIEGDRATAETNFCMTSLAVGGGDQREIRVVMAGRYLDELERTGGGWLFRVRRSCPDRP